MITKSLQSRGTHGTGIAPWTIPVVEEFPYGFRPGDKVKYGHVTPLHPDGIRAPKFLFSPDAGPLSGALLLAREWVRAELGQRPKFPEELLPADFKA